MLMKVLIRVKLEICKVKLKMLMKVLIRIKRFDFSSCSAKSKCYDDSNKLAVAKMNKMKNGMGGVAIKEFFRLKPKIYLVLVDDNS